MKFIDFFSGIGGFHSGLEQAGMECVGWCEFDKFAQKSYREMYDTEGMWFSDDVRKVRGSELPRADVWAFGFPCQDVSIAGKQRGILIKTANKQGYAMAYHGDGVDLAYPNSETRRGRVQPQRANTLTTSDNLGVVLDDGSKVYIRKLTPRECWRLQGFTDEQFDKAAAVNSNSQLYKQAGNAVSVNVVAEIGKHIMAVERGNI